MALDIVFMGTPEFAAATLAAVHEAGHRIAAVYTQPPRPGGRRGLEPVKSPVHRLGEALGLEVRTPASLKEAAAQEYAALGADVAVVVAYGMLLPEPILAATRRGALNAHASALPRWRGAAPIQRAIMAGDKVTAATIMQMDAGLDTGPVALARTLEIGPDETAGQLHDRLMQASAELMCEALALLEKDALELSPQPAHGVVYAAKIAKEETRIDWRRPASEVHNHIRGLSPFPGAWCEMRIAGKDERVKILGSRLAQGSGQPRERLGEGLTIACGTGAVELTQLQRAGGKALGAAEFMRGATIEAIR